MTAEPVTFGEAIDALIHGKAKFIRRKAWKPEMRIYLQTPDAHSKMSFPYLYMESVGDSWGGNMNKLTRIPWEPGHASIFAADWEVV